MKKLLLLFVPLILLGTVGGAVWWKYGRGRDPLANAQRLMDAGDLRGAQLELRTAVRANPNNAAAHFRLGQIDLRGGDPVAAEKELKTARDQGFEARLVTLPLAQSYMGQGKYRELLRDFSPQGLPPDQASPLLVMRATAQLSLGDTSAATVTIADAERLAPQSTDAALASARVQLALRDYQAAEAKVDRALQINPRATDALIFKAQLQNLKGDRVRALEGFDTVLALNPNLLVARLERANLLLMDGKDARAREDVDAGLAIEPRSSMGIYLRAVLEIKAEDYINAEADLSKISSIIGRYPRGFFFYAIAKYNIGQAEQASEAANKYLAKNPTDPDALKLFARIELAGKRSAGVISTLGRVQENGLADSEILELLSRAYALAGKTDLALQTLERAAALAPNNADLLTRLASFRLAIGDAGRAASDLDRALQISPGQEGAGEKLVLAALTTGEVDRAAVALDNLRRLQGESETVGNLAALIRMATLDVDGAQEQLEKTIKAFPDAIQPRINLAKVFVLQNKGDEARRVLVEVLNRRPTEMAALSALTNLLIVDAKATEALGWLERAHAAAPKDIDITIALANHQARLGETLKAIALADEVLKDQPSSAPLLVAKARLLTAVGKPDEALAAYRRALEENPLDSATRRATADLLFANNDPGAARATLTEGIKADPGNNELMQAQVALALRTGGIDEAFTVADRLGRDPANLPNARWLRGDALMAAGRFIDAVTSYSTDQRASPSTAGMLRLISALNASGRADQATLAAREWLRANPTDGQVAEALATLDLAARRFFEAEKQLLTVLAQRPSDPSALNNLAWVYQQRADGRARQIAQKSYLLSPTPESADTLGWILTTSGNAPTGLALLRQAAAGLPREPTIAYHLAVALKNTDHRDEAIKVLRPIVQGLLDFDDRPAAAKLLEELAPG